MSLGNAIVIGILLTQVVLIFGFVLTERRQPAVTLAWIMGVAFLPVIGAILFLVFGRRRMVRHSVRYHEVSLRIEEALKQAGLLHAIDVIDGEVGLYILELNPNPFCYFYNRSNGREDFIRLYEGLIDRFVR